MLIPDDDVGFQGFHDVMLFDRTKDDAPYVADLVISGMANRQLELKELRRMCKKKYCEAPMGVLYILSQTRLRTIVFVTGGF